jgi:hypothetical protein
MQVEISPFNRSSVTNGRRRHRRGTVDGRSHSARRWRDIFLGLVAELGHEPNAAEESLLKSAASLALRSETLAADIAAGRAINDDELNRVGFSLRRTLAMLGLAGVDPEPPAAPTLEQLWGMK